MEILAIEDYPAIPDIQRYTGPWPIDTPLITGSGVIVAVAFVGVSPSGNFLALYDGPKNDGVILAAVNSQPGIPTSIHLPWPFVRYYTEVRIDTVGLYSGTIHYIPER